MIDVAIFQPHHTSFNELTQLKNTLNSEKLPIRRLNSLSNIDLLCSNLHLYQLLLFYTTDSYEDYYIVHKKLFEIKHTILVVLVADSSTLLSDYTLPDVCPDAILYRPLAISHFVKTIRQCYKLISDKLYFDQHQSIAVQIGKSTHRIRINDIYFIESLGKKLAIKTRSQEVQFYGTFDSIGQRLPANFIRCHKGFLVNVNKIYSIDFSLMTIQLSDQSVVPMSRTYKSLFKSQMQGGGIYDEG